MINLVLMFESNYSMIQVCRYFLSQYNKSTHLLIYYVNTNYEQCIGSRYLLAFGFWIRILYNLYKQNFKIKI